MTSGSTSTIKRHLLIKSGSEYHKVPLSDILYIESNNNKIVVHTISSMVESYQRIRDIEEKLDTSFFKCHRCYIINMEHVVGYNTSIVKLNSDINVPVARRRYPLFVNKLVFLAENA